MTPFFSVVIPVYNRAKFLGVAIQSVLQQTCQDFEIVVIDDGSKDDPASVAQSFSDPRIRFFRQPNAGGGAARNHGFDEARGNFVALLDSDDQFEPRHLEAMKPLLEGKTNILGYAPVVGDRGNGRSILRPLRCIQPGEHMATYLLCDRGFIPTMTMVVETGIARKVRFPENLRSAEDTDFAIRLYLEGCQFVMAREPGAIWRDSYDADRTSGSGRQNLAMIEWIEGLKTRLPSRAYYGCYGWAIAKSVVIQSPTKALGLYANALLRGCYRLPVAGIVFLQIFMPDKLYRWVSDSAIAWFGKLWDARREKLAPVQHPPAVA